MGAIDDFTFDTLAPPPSASTPSSSSFELDIDPTQHQHALIQYAEYMPRVGAFFLDQIFVNIIGSGIAFVLGCVIGIILAGMGVDVSQDPAVMIIFQGFFAIFGLFINALYYVLQESSAKQGTFGKQICGIKVTDLDGNRITAGRAIGRWFAKWLTGCTFGIGLLMPLWTERKQTLHDMLSGCLALKK